MQALGRREHARHAAYHAVQLVLGARPPPAARAANPSVRCAPATSQRGSGGQRPPGPQSTSAVNGTGGDGHGPVSKRAAGAADAWVAYHVSDLVRQTELSLSAWEAETGSLCAPWLLAGLGTNIYLQAPQNRVAVYTILQALLVIMLLVQNP